ncbi:MAG: hypothetical protein ACRD6W_03545 [Nitrososphaerales archaeon]
MTIVAAIVTPEGAWMGADSLSSTDDFCIVTSNPKIAKVGQRLIGFAGSWSAGHAMVRHAKANRGFSLSDLLESFDGSGAEGHFLVLDNREIFEIQDEKFVVRIPSRGGYCYNAIGAGAAQACGAMFVARELGVSGPDALRFALKAAEAHSPHCRRPFRILECS